MYYNNSYYDELYHFGVKGMKWGHRKKYYDSNGSLNRLGKAKQDYDNSKRTVKEAIKSAPFFAIGMKGLQKYSAAQKRILNAEVNSVSAKAKYNAAKAKSKAKADKAEFKTYRKEMSKTGLAGSYADQQSGGRSTALYNKLKVAKGKAYADRVAKKVQNRAVTGLAASGVVAVGATVVSAMLAVRSAS